MHYGCIHWLKKSLWPYEWKWIVWHQRCCTELDNELLGKQITVCIYRRESFQSVTCVMWSTTGCSAWTEIVHINDVHDIKYNSAKSNVMIFRCNKMKDIRIPNFELNNVLLTRVTKYKYLGHCSHMSVSRGLPTCKMLIRKSIIIWFYDIYKEVMQYNIAEHCWKWPHIYTSPIAPALETFAICTCILVSLVFIA